jgi:hypothetical protein
MNLIFMPAPPDRPQPVTSLAGRYRLDLNGDERRVQDPGCSAIPASATQRSYTADIVSLGDRHAVRLYDATFLVDRVAGLTGFGCRDPRLPQPDYAACHQLLLTGDAGALTLTAGSLDEGSGSEIWEGQPDGFVTQMIGSASGAMTGGRIDAVGTGTAVSPR